MSLVSRLTCSSGRMIAKKLILRPLPHPVLQSMKHLSDKGKDPLDDLIPKKVHPSPKGYDHQHPTKAHPEPEEINPSDPHTMGTGFSDIHVAPGVGRPPSRPPKTVEEFANPDPNTWISWGVDYFDKERDRRETHFIFFLVVTGILYGTGAMLWYLPDVHLDNWVTREAYMEIERRQNLGGPYVDADYVPRHLINLPTEEEIGETDIII